MSFSDTKSTGPFLAVGKWWPVSSRRLADREDRVPGLAALLPYVLVLHTSHFYFVTFTAVFGLKPSDQRQAFQKRLWTSSHKKCLPVL